MRRYSLACSLLLALPLLLAACGNSVETSPGTGGAGGSGSGSTSSATSSSTSSSSGGGGGGQALCGGLSGATCDAEEFCDWADDSCGGDDGQGVCLPRPTGACPPDCPGVCGCDGQFYCSECAAHEAGIDVSANISCAPGAGQYSAFWWSGGLDHLIVYKADPDADRCTIVYLAWPYQSAPAFQVTLPVEWGVVGAQITSSAADCAVPMSPPVGEAFDAAGGTGSMSWVVAPGMYAPCEIDVDVVLQFPGAPAWAPAMDSLSATAVTVEGGCM